MVFNYPTTECLLGEGAMEREQAHGQEANEGEDDAVFEKSIHEYCVI